MSEDQNDDQFDDYEFGGGYADGKSTAKIAEEQSFPEIPTGRNDFFIKKVVPKTDANGGILITRNKVFVASEEGGRADTEQGCDLVELVVTWAMVSNEKMTINEYFKILPPGDESDPEVQENAEIYATSASKEGAKIALDYNRYRHFLGGLGFETEDGSIPEEARRLRNLKYWDDGESQVEDLPRRIVSLDIGIQKEKDENGKYTKVKMGANGKPFKQVNMFCHLKTKDTEDRLSGIDPFDSDTDDDAGEPAEPEAPAPEPEPVKPAPTRTAPKTTAAPKATTAPKATPAPASKAAPAPKTGRTNLKF